MLRLLEELDPLVQLAFKPGDLLRLRHHIDIHRLDLPLELVVLISHIRNQLGDETLLIRLLFLEQLEARFEFNVDIL